jgi:hypothetical protein
VSDLTRYSGKHCFEVILVINNYPVEEPPPEIQLYGDLGMKVLSIPNLRRPGEVASITARMYGFRAALSETGISFDADCRIPNPTALIDWYIAQLQAGAQAAYTHVGYYRLRDRWSVRARIVIHHLARWVKRVVLGIPTVRGSNYAVRVSTLISLYEQGLVADELNVGPTAKASGARVRYSGARELRVLTSGRMFRGGWLKLCRYLGYRLRYNLRVLPVRPNAARYTGRDNEPARRYVNNIPVP